jgi:hypothetical protein
MDVPISQFRRDLFELAGRALGGESIAMVYKGQRLRLIPDVDPITRFDRLTPMRIVNPNMPDLDDPVAKAEMLAEMEKAWEEDWAEL